MKRILPLLLLLLCAPLSGCSATSATPAATLAPGYSSTADQTLGEALAAVNAFVNQEKVNYAAMTPTSQAAEKNFINNLITATNIADSAYTSFHLGTGTLPAAQQALVTAQNAQAALAAQKGVK